MSRPIGFAPARSNPRFLGLKYPVARRPLLPADPHRPSELFFPQLNTPPRDFGNARPSRVTAGTNHILGQRPRQPAQRTVWHCLQSPPSRFRTGSFFPPDRECPAATPHRRTSGRFRRRPARRRPKPVPAGIAHPACCRPLRAPIVREPPP